MTTPAASSPGAPGEPRRIDPDAPVLELPNGPRPAPVTLVVIYGLLATLGAAIAFATNLPSNASVLLLAGMAIAAFGFVHVSLHRGQGWARMVRSVIAVTILGFLLFVLALVSTEEPSARAIGILAVGIVLEALVLAALHNRLVAQWFTRFDIREALQDLKWAVVLLFLTILGLSGWSNSTWQVRPKGREDIGRIVAQILGENQLVFLLQLVGILLVAALIGSVVLAIREPEDELPSSRDAHDAEHDLKQGVH